MDSGNDNAGAAIIEEPEYDSDATTLDLEMTPKQTLSVSECNNPGPGSNSSTSMETVYNTDPDYSGPCPQSQLCQRRGISNTPLGWKKTYQKKRKLYCSDADHDMADK